MYLSRSVDERILDVVRRLCARLHEHQSVFFGERFALLRRDLAPVCEVAFVSYEHDGHVCVGVLLGILEPACEVVEGFSPRDVVYEQRTRRTPVVASCDAAEALLSRGVPNLQFDLLSVDCDEPRSKLDADGEVVHWLKALVCELQEEARLADAGVSDDDVLEEVLRMYKFVFVRKTCYRLLVWLVGKT